MMNPVVALPWAGTVTVLAVSYEKGTSTPSVFRPSVRRYDTWMRLIVTWLFDVNATSASLGARLKEIVPVSLKIVGQGLVVEHVPPVVMIVRTSEVKFVVAAPPPFAEP